MFERFTDKAHKVMAIAQDEARSAEHMYVGTEHLLLALIKEGEGIAARALAGLGVAYDEAVTIVMEITNHRATEPVPGGGHIPFTPRTKRVLEDLNATKDRMYCSAPASHERRSAQTIWSYLLTMLVSDLQPILAYTTDEVLEFMPASLSGGVRFAALLNWWSAPMTKAEIDDVLPTYRILLEVRSAFTKAYEDALASHELLEKTTQAARATITLPSSDYAVLSNDEQVDLSEVLVCAHTEVVCGDEFSVRVEPAEGERCLRCWNWREVDGEKLCPRCREVVDGMKQN